MSETVSRRAERRTRQRATNRAAILDAARRVAAKQGAGNLSLRSVAAEAGYAPASVYEYFQNRAELVIALASDDLALLARELRENRQPTPSLKRSAGLVLDSLQNSRALPAAISSMATDATNGSDAGRLFNGKLIAALTGFAESAGLGPVSELRRQADVILAVSALIGISALSRSGRLSALSIDPALLIDRLAALLAPQMQDIG